MKHKVLMLSFKPSVATVELVPFTTCLSIVQAKRVQEERLSELSLLLLKTIIKETVVIATCLMIKPPLKWLLKVRKEQSLQIILLLCCNSNSLLTMPRCFLAVRSCDYKNKNNKSNSILPAMKQRTQIPNMKGLQWTKGWIAAIEIWIRTRALKVWREEAPQKMIIITHSPGLNRRKIYNNYSRVAVANSNNSSSQLTWKNILLKKNWWYWRIFTTPVELLVISNSQQNNPTISIRVMHSRKFFISKMTKFKICSSTNLVWLSIRILRPMERILTILKGMSKSHLWLFKTKSHKNRNSTHLAVGRSQTNSSLLNNSCSYSRTRLNQM